MKKNKIFLILILCLTQTACQSIKSGLSGGKSENNDEFLVQKKNPLVLPPNYLKLPKPKDSITETEDVSLNQDDFDIQKLLGIEEDVKNLPSAKNEDVEEFVLRSIKNN